jgi:hypothetical protein
MKAQAASLAAADGQLFNMRCIAQAHILRMLIAMPEWCHYVLNGETRYFTVARIPRPHVLEVSELVAPPVSRILESM